MATEPCRPFDCNRRVPGYESKHAVQHMKHLQTLAPKLFAKLEKANENSLRKICYRVCDYAATANRPHDPLIDEVIGYLRLGNKCRQGTAAELDELMNRLDERYFDLKDRVDEMMESPVASNYLLSLMNIFGRRESRQRFVLLSVRMHLRRQRSRSMKLLRALIIMSTYLILRRASFDFCGAPGE